MMVSQVFPGSLDVAFSGVDTPFGPVFIAVTAKGVARVGLPGYAEATLVDELVHNFGPRVTRSAALIAAANTALSRVLSGKRAGIPLDLSRVRGFRLPALAAIGRIPVGETRSYSQIAADAGSPQASRAVGSACAQNPVPLFIPCHRVVRADGSLGNYGGGVRLKAALLQWEAKFNQTLVK